MKKYNPSRFYFWQPSIEVVFNCIICMESINMEYVNRFVFKILYCIIKFHTQHSCKI